jgi:hypothetical protein
VAGSISSGIVTAIRPLSLQGREEAFRGGVVPTIASATHAAGDAVCAQQPLEVFAGVLASLVRMMQQRPRGASAPNRQHRVGDELRRHLRAHRPANHVAREQIEGYGDIHGVLKVLTALLP